MGQSKRKLRNYLLDKRFQLKYTGIVIGLTALLSAALGYFLHREIVVSQNTILARDLASDTFIIPPLDPEEIFEATEEVTNRIHDEVGEASRANLAVVISINNAPAGTTASLYQESFNQEIRRRSTVLVTALLVFLIVLAFFWVFLTHRIAGPVFKLKLLFSSVDGENMKVASRLRKTDELQDAFVEFKRMMGRLQEDRRQKAEILTSMIGKLEEEPTMEPEELEKLKEIERALLDSIAD